MKHNTLLVISITVISLLAGCAAKRDVTKGQLSFLLELPNPPAAAGKIPGTLKIRYCRAAAGFETQLFLYRNQAGQYQQDYYKQFISPPNEQITDLLRTWIDAAGLFNSVLPATSAAESEYTLEPHLLAIYTDLTEAGTPLTVLKMHFVLLKYDSTCRCSTIVLEKTYERRQSVQNAVDGGIIVGYNEIFADICTQLISDINDTIKK